MVLEESAAQSAGSVDRHYSTQDYTSRHTRSRFSVIYCVALGDVDIALFTIDLGHLSFA